MKIHKKISIKSLFLKWQKMAISDRFKSCLAETCQEVKNSTINPMWMTNLDSGVLWNLAEYDSAALVGRANTKSGFVHLHKRRTFNNDTQHWQPGQRCSKQWRLLLLALSYNSLVNSTGSLGCQLPFGWKYQICNVFYSQKNVTFSTISSMTKSYFAVKFMPKPKQEIWANAHETRDSTSLISYAGCLGLSPVISAKIHS